MNHIHTCPTCGHQRRVGAPIPALSLSVRTRKAFAGYGMTHAAIAEIGADRWLAMTPLARKVLQNAYLRYPYKSNSKHRRLK